jgi:deoxyribodipyrimidine photolyase-like uncharacterized protein
MIRKWLAEEKVKYTVEYVEDIIDQGDYFIDDQGKKVFNNENDTVIVFGNYQDAIQKDEEFLFHSLLSSSINIGLLNPKDIIELILKAKAPINSVEGFIRQLFWREYQRYCYIYCNFNNKNYNTNTIFLIVFKLSI